MSIAIITNEFPSLTSGQKAAITRFVNNNCSYYYFLNFIRITNGNVKDAISLYHFDEDLREVILKFILRFEVQMKKDFINCVEKTNGQSSFWDNPYLYNSSFTRMPHGRLSKFGENKRRIQKQINKMNFSSSGPINDRALYCSSFGCFIKIVDNIKQQYKNDFNDKYVGYINDSSRELHKYLNCIRITRNRCCHSNHIVSKKFRYDISTNINLYRFSSLPLTNFEKILYFIYKNLDNKKGFKEEILKVLTKYSAVWLKYAGDHLLTNNTINNLEHF